MDALIEYAKIAAKLLWPVTDRTSTSCSLETPELAGQERLPPSIDAIEYLTETKHFVTPGGIEFEMGYNTERDWLVITTN